MTDSLTLYTRRELPTARLIEVLSRETGLPCCNGTYPDPSAVAVLLTATNATGLLHVVNLVWPPGADSAAPTARVAQAIADDFDTDVLFEADDPATDGVDGPWLLAVAKGGRPRAVSVRLGDDGVDLLDAPQDAATRAEQAMEAARSSLRRAFVEGLGERALPVLPWCVPTFQVVMKKRVFRYAVELLFKPTEAPDEGVDARGMRTREDPASGERQVVIGDSLRAQRIFDATSPLSDPTAVYPSALLDEEQLARLIYTGRIQRNERWREDFNV